MDAIQKKLLNGRPGPSAKTKLEAMADRLYNRWLDRVNVVNDGYERCSGGRCPRGTQAWEDWSTPSRDRVVGALVDGLVAQIAASRGDAAAEEYWRGIENVEVVDLGGGSKLSFGQLVEIWQRKAFSSEPGDAPAARWGFGR